MRRGAILAALACALAVPAGARQGGVMAISGCSLGCTPSGTSVSCSSTSVYENGVIEVRFTRAVDPASVDFMSDVKSVRVPALAITGEPGLDRTVPVELTRRYVDLLPDCRHVVLERSGHMGTATRPREFAALVSAFVNGHGDWHAAARRAM